MAGPVFITYSSRDRDVADVVRAHLESTGMSVWIAPRDVPVGMSYPEAIIGAIRDRSVGLLVLSDQSNSSPHVLREVERISADGKPLYVLRVEPVELSDGLAYFTSMLQWIEAPRDRLVRDPGTILKPIVNNQHVERPTPSAAIDQGALAESRPTAVATATSTSRHSPTHSGGCSSPSASQYSTTSVNSPIRRHPSQRASCWRG